LIACLCVYYDERESWLSQHLSSWAGVCDAFVYVDGAYFRFPGAMPRPASDVGAALALHETAAIFGAELIHYRPSHPFYGEQVEKRNFSLALGRALPEAGPETWFLVADADTFAVHLDPEGLADVLRATDANVAEISVHTLAPDDGTPRSERDKPQPYRGLFRNLPGLSYGPPPHHGHLSWQPVAGGERRYLRGGALTGQETPENVRAYVVAEHRAALRDRERLEARNRYYRSRDALGV